jgi:hypothetical protein
MPKMLRGMDGDYALAGTKRGKKGKKAKKRSRVSFSPAKMGLKLTSEKKCLKKGTRKLKKGCVWGRGKYKGKIFTSKAA